MAHHLYVKKKFFAQLFQLGYLSKIMKRIGLICCANVFQCCCISVSGFICALPQFLFIRSFCCCLGASSGLIIMVVLTVVKRILHCKSITFVYPFFSVFINIKEKPAGKPVTADLTYSSEKSNTQNYITLNP